MTARLMLIWLRLARESRARRRQARRAGARLRRVRRAAARKARAQRSAAARAKRRRRPQAPRRRAARQPTPRWQAADPPSGSPGDRAAAAAAPDPDSAVEPAPGFQANSSREAASWETAFLRGSPLPLPLRRPDFPVDLVPSVVDIAFPSSRVNPKVETLSCLRWNCGSCLSVARRSRGEILKVRAGGRFWRSLTPLPLLRALFP